MGGIWESEIRTVRSVLCVLLEKNGHQMNDEALRTFMCEAEAVVNSRPLTAEGTTLSDTAETTHSQSLPDCENEGSFASTRKIHFL